MFRLTMVSLILGIAASPALAFDHATVTISSANLTTFETREDDRGDYYLLRFQVPEAMSGKDMDAVILELYVDAGAFGRRADLYENAGPGQPTAFVNNAPVLEVFLPRASYQGGVDGDALDLSARVSEPIVLGEGKRVMIDVTKLVRGIVAGTQSNHGLVLGSITGMREGDFSILSGVVGSGAVAKLHFYPSPTD